LLERHENPKQFHGIDGFGDAVHEEEADLSPRQTEHAANALVRLVKENPGQITLVALGPMSPWLSGWMRNSRRS
jgi:purine nucleosidase